MSPRHPTGWPAPDPVRAGHSLPGPLTPVPYQAQHQALLQAVLVRSIANGERYMRALRVQDATARAARQHEAISPGRRDATRVGTMDTTAFTNRLRYAARLAAQPRATIRPGLTPGERQWQDLAATMPYELALMIRFDPVLRTMAAGGAVTTAAVAAPVAYEVTVAHLKTVTIESFATKITVNALGQGIGNYIVKRDALQAVKSINLLSIAASGLNVPLGYNSLFSAGFNWSYENKFKSITTGDISAYEFGRDAAFNYGFGKVAAGFKLPGPAGRSWLGLDKLYQTQPMNTGIGFGTYQALLRLGPTTGYGFGVGLNTGLEQGNKILVGAAKKYLSSKVKEQFPDPHKKHGH